MDFLPPDDPRPIHFVGIAGAGMSALALLARRRGVPVSGCDWDPARAAGGVAVGGGGPRGWRAPHRPRLAAIRRACQGDVSAGGVETRGSAAPRCMWSRRM